MSMRKAQSQSRAACGVLLVALLAGCYANDAGTNATNRLGTSKANLPAVSVSISPDKLDPGQTALATWDSSAATKCVASGAWSGTVALSNDSGLTIGPFSTPGTYSFTVTCTGAGGTTAASEILTVGRVPAPTVQMDIIPSTILPGSSAVITWSTTNATGCVGSAGTTGWQGDQPTANLSGFNTGAIPASGAYEYDLTCTGSGGSTQVTRILTVTPTAPPGAPVIFFAAQPTQVTPGQSTTLSWTTTNASSCAASGGTGADHWHGAQPTSSTGFASGSLLLEGSYAFTLTCTGGGGSTAKTATVVVSPSLAPPVVAVNIDVTPSQIASGESAYLSWSTANADACTASGSWSGVEPVLGVLVSTGTLTTPGVYAYQLTCTGPGGSASGTASLTVNAPPAEVTAFAANPIAITAGQSISLSWSTDYATSCTASGGSSGDHWTGTEPASSTGLSIGPVNTLGTVLYTIDCTGPGGTGAPRSVGVVVSPVAPVPVGITVFAAVPSSITVGQSATLNWVTVGASSCTATGGTGSDGWNGSVGTQSVATSTGPINTAGAYTYTLTCTGPGGTNASSVVVNVSPAPSGPAVITSFSVSPSTIQSGQAAALTWTTSGATTCTASGGTGPWTGSQATSSTGTSTGNIATAGIYTYTLTCSGPGGTSLPRSALLAVANSPAAAAVVSFTANPTIIVAGQSSTLAWSTQNATACTASGAWSGAENTSSTGTSTGALNTAGTYTYTLTCTGAGGSAGPASVIVVVTPAPSAPASIVAFAVTPSTIESGQSALLTWVTLNATSCTASAGTGSWGGAVGTSSLATDTGIITTVGSYTYTLTCTGPGGASAPSSVVLNVTSVPPPPATISIFTATPNTVQTGQSVLLAWTSIGSTSCTATGGTGSDGWSGTEPATGVDTVGPLNSAGVYIYTLTCTGPGGASSPTSVTVDVNSTPPPPAITAFAVAPATLQTGSSATATWSSTAATSCTASGGTSGDGWSGTLPPQSTGTSIGPINTVGLATYMLTCTGAGGTSLPSTATVLVTQTAPPASVSKFTATPTAIQVGQSAQLAWTSSNATSCNATGGTNSWGGAVPTSSSGTSTGSINTVGVYTYYLTCTGAGGTGLPAAAIVAVTALPPPVTISSFTATPAALQLGQSTTLAWSTNGATACTASGGTGADGWGGVVAASNAGVVIGPFNSTGTYIYSLICTGPGGISAPSSLSVTVSPATPAATIGSFTAAPTFVQAGQSTSLAWSSSNASSCTAGGGTGSDGWTGTVGTSSTGLSVGPLSTGTITYTLTCTGPGGTSAPSSVNVTVNPAVPPPPTVTLAANGANPGLVQPGATITLSWTSSNATSCTASGGAGGWSGTQPTSSAGVTVTPINTPGIYSYTLTCAGAGGSGASTVQVTVISTQSYDCGVPSIPTSALVSPAATVSSSTAGACILGCSVTNTGNVVNSTPTDYATLSIPLAIAGTTTLEVSGTAAFPAGRKAGFILANGNSLLNAALVGGIKIQTLLNGVVQETATTTGLGDVAQVQAAGLLSIDQYAGYFEFTTTLPFNDVQIVAGSLAAVNSNLRVYSACVSQQ